MPRVEIHDLGVLRRQLGREVGRVIEAEGSDKPACVAETVSRRYQGQR